MIIAFFPVVFNKKAPAAEIRSGDGEAGYHFFFILIIRSIAKGLITRE